MIPQLIYKVFLFFTTLIYPLRNVFILIGGGYFLYWVFIKYPRSARNNNEMEPSFSHKTYKNFLFHVVLASFLISFGFALVLQNVYQDGFTYLFIFPLICFSLPILMIFGFAIQAFAYEIYETRISNKD